MSDKSDVQVVIDGNVITISGDESAEYMQKVARYVNNKKSEIESSEDFKSLSREYQSLLLSLNIADDYFKARDKVDSLTAELEDMNKKLYDIQHEQIETRIKYESAVKMMDDYKGQVADMQKKLLAAGDAKKKTAARKTAQTAASSGTGAKKE